MTPHHPPHRNPHARTEADALPVIEGLPAIEYIETYDIVTGRRFTVQFVDGSSITFTVTRTDMVAYERNYPGTNAARSLFIERTRQAYAATQHDVSG